MGKLTLYGIDGSPPVRSVHLTLHALGLKYDYKIVNLMTGEHLKPEYLKVNPLHTVPTLEDDGFFIHDSHAINAYLVGKYGKDDSMYPKDLQKRAIVDQRLHYDSSVMVATGKGLFIPLKEGKTEIPKAKFDALEEVYKNLNLFLEQGDFVAGSDLTIADFHTIAVLSTTIPFRDVNATKYPKLADWVNRVIKLPFYEEANGSRIVQVVGFIKNKKYDIV
ncbi:glutathione S-transferase 1-1-like [Drosophila bipectinata]|uniref:glutathione S-transferase 1-1-like n=1 Tax=Drosophila bipectinata TaxID=42026 RepID=UPI001C89B119|nr:glutathione S-transferase 1-1-like [Drosophila bipectinata]